MQCANPVAREEGAVALENVPPRFPHRLFISDFVALLKLKCVTVCVDCRMLQTTVTVLLRRKFLASLKYRAIIGAYKYIALISI
ncbi:hypothetical protein EDD55_109107 [Varunaivibrio sulfuroxidans]|uniref:Uncharacterized protein n=1 Tax=Varunaivibrio sulfuroxidans TaxID=1773489 RepID=A0A4R3J7R6_9PROT|nr:hypothetical protein EDD55_109107 [Varunaivibrio sulfuroxidans]